MKRSTPAEVIAHCQAIIAMLERQREARRRSGGSW